MIVTEPPVLITEKPGPGVAVGDGAGDGSGELWGTAAGATVITSREMVEELSDEVGVFSTVASVIAFVMLAHVKFLIWSSRATLFCSAPEAAWPRCTSFTVVPKSAYKPARPIARTPPAMMISTSVVPRSCCAGVFRVPSKRWNRSSER